MNTFVQTRNTLRTLLTQLEQLQGPEKITHACRIAKERETGKQCYQAEEDLLQAELSLLRDTLNLEKSHWEAYKQICREDMQKWLQE